MSTRKIILSLFMVGLITLPKSPLMAQASPKEVRGNYQRNLAEGWRNYTRPDGSEIEVIPQKSQMEYLQLKRFNKFTNTYGSNELEFTVKGGYSLTGDTIELISAQMVDVGEEKLQRIEVKSRYLFTPSCGLLPLKPKEQGYYRLKPYCKN